MLLYKLPSSKIMQTIHLKRGFLWVGSLILTLFKFWIKNPKYTPAVLNFVIKKTLASPRFISRNILIEKHSLQFKRKLSETVQLYRKFGKSFELENPQTYKKLETILSDKAQILYFIIRKLKPKIVVETGVAAGKSTGYILQAMKDNSSGKLYSIDLPFQWYIYKDQTLHLDSLPPGKTPGYLIPEYLKKYWHLILGNTYDKLSSLLNSLGKIDIFLHDSEHSEKNMMFEFQTSWPYIKKNGFLLSDDISYTNAFKIFSKNKRVNKIVFKDLGIITKNI